MAWKEQSVSPVWSFILEGIGITGALIAGRRHWFAWIILLVNTALWGAYAVVTDQYGFLVASFFYAPVYGRNAWKWYHGEIDSPIMKGE
jgi:hypothetical protein